MFEEMEELVRGMNEKLNIRPTRPSDNVNHPEHYTFGGVECIDAIEAATDGLDGIEAVCTGTAIKYLWRWKRKNGVEDLKKSLWYINRLIQKLERSEANETESEA